MTQEKCEISNSVFGYKSRLCLDDLKTSTKNKIKNSKYLDELTEDDQISIVSNSMFFTMLCNESRKKFVCKLLSTLLKCDYAELLENSRYYKNEFNKDSVENKSERGDLVINLNGDYISVEMNSRDETNRNVEYTDRLYNSKIKVGDKYIYPKILSININNFYYEELPKHIERFRIQSDDKVCLVYKEYIHIYLPLLFQKWYNEGTEKLEDYEKVMLAMATTNRREALELVKGDDIMEEYVEEAKLAEKSDNFLKEAYDHELSERLAAREEGYDEGHEEGFEEGHDEGFEEGHEEGLKAGREQGSLQTQQKIIQTMFKNGMSINDIHKSTEIPTEEIEMIIKNDGSNK